MQKKLCSNVNSQSEPNEIRAMNYLAHLVIGGPDPHLMVGNFMGDAIKGRAHSLLPDAIAEGVMMHRWIDSEADAHPASIASRADLRPVLGRMSAVGLDLLHDHFLAQNFEVVLPAWPLGQFVGHVETILSERQLEMPERSQRFLNAMVQHRWLMGYGDREEMIKVCASMDARLAWESNLDQLFEAVDVIGASVLEERFLELMTDLMARRSAKWPSW
jgi:acyl carrier protein phosphodiesterase